MTRWIDSALSYLYVWPIGILVVASGISLLFGVIGLWSLWRVRRLLAVVPLVQDRLDALSNSVTLLADTTESCFKALAMQLQFIQSQIGVSASSSGRGAGLGSAQNEAQAYSLRPDQCAHQDLLTLLCPFPTEVSRQRYLDSTPGAEVCIQRP